MTKNYIGNVGYKSDLPPQVGLSSIFRSDGVGDGYNLAVTPIVTVTTNTYTLDASNLGAQLYFTYAGAVTITIADSAKGLNPGIFWMWAAASGTSLTFILAGGSDTLLGSTTGAATESGTIVLRALNIYENDPRYQVAGPGAGDVIGPSSATDNAITRFNSTTGKLIQNSGVTIDDSGNISDSNPVIGSTLNMVLENSDNTNAASHVKTQLVSGGTSGGNAWSQYTILGAQDWSVGVTQAAGHPFTISASAIVGTTNLLTLSTAGVLTLLSGDMQVNRANIGGQVLAQVQNTDNTNGASQAALNLIVGGSSAGDAYIFYSATGGANYIQGLDNSTGNFAIAPTALGTGNLMTLTSSGAVTYASSITSTAGAITATNGNLVLGTAGNKLIIPTGANASMGTSAAMTSGSITISTTAVTASSKIFLTYNTPGGTQGSLNAPTAAIVAGTSFVIQSSSNTDTSTVNWWIVN